MFLSLFFSPPHLFLHLVALLHIGKHTVKYVFLLHYSSSEKNHLEQFKSTSINYTCAPKAIALVVELT